MTVSAGCQLYPRGVKIYADKVAALKTDRAESCGCTVCRKRTSVVL